MLSVGLLGGKGYMGSALLPALHTASKEGKLKLVLLLRASSKGYPSDVEHRIIDLEEGNVDKLRKAVNGLNLVVSAISGRSLDLQYPLIDALQGSKDLISFFPTEWATPQNKEDQQSPYLKGTINKAKVVQYAKAKGVPTTVCATASIPELIFGHTWGGVDLKGNKLDLYPGPRDKARGVASREYVGAAFTHLLLRSSTPAELSSDIADRSFSLVERDVTQSDLIAILTSIHGTEPTITEYTQEMYERDLRAGFGEAMAAAGKRWLGVGVDWPGERVQVPGWKGETLEEMARHFV